MKIGIVGYGGFGRFLHRAWSGVEGAAVTHIADPAVADVPESLKRFESWRELLDTEIVDVVSVATPPHSHAEIAAEAMSRGCNVLIEKPIATTLADADRIIAARDMYGRAATVDFMLRFNPIVACIHEWSRSGVFGKLQRVVIENYAQDESLGPEHWFWDKQESGGILVEHAVHFFDIVNAATSADVTNVYQRTWSRNDTQEDRVFSLVEYADGLVATHYHAFNRLNQFERSTMRFVFDGAQIDTLGWIPMSGRVLALVNGETLDALAPLPDLRILDEETVRANRDLPLAESKHDQARVDTLVTAGFDIGGSKEDAYLAALRDLMADFLRACHDRSHRPVVGLEDGLAALKVALGPSAGRRSS